MDARQSLSSPANRAERRAQRLPFQTQYQHFDPFLFLLRVLKRFDASSLLSFLPSFLLSFLSCMLLLYVAQNVRTDAQPGLTLERVKAALRSEMTELRRKQTALLPPRLKKGKEKIMSDCRMKQTISHQPEPVATRVIAGVYNAALRTITLGFNLYSLRFG